ncbi:uncharacterized protein N7511_010440 [Penicillium nucicola]|uniref:uncharacterized protein n=1 Tax=Penicillium nucicola TaxID=1850975 RepID=UPI002545A925|nr:uncharacterized protein N7511_010440 [Penicillium nucicola]KAJ5748744.1 hypothetical protein N7511_010440 [Penicillium nucicola]
MESSPTSPSGDPWKLADPYYPAPIGAVEAAENPVQASFRFIVRRASHAEPSATHVLNTWVNSSYLIWAVCAALADDGVDEEWTRKFQKWRPLWNKIQQDVQYFQDGHRAFVSNKFFMKIPAPPIHRMLVQQFDGPKFFPLRAPHFLQHCPGCPSCHGDGHHHEDIWDLWRYIYRAPVSSPLIFCVTFQDDQRIKSVRFEDNREVSHRSESVPQKQRPRGAETSKMKTSGMDKASRTKVLPTIKVITETAKSFAIEEPKAETALNMERLSENQSSPIPRRLSKLKQILNME